jgi:hypothetical protein
VTRYSNVAGAVWRSCSRLSCPRFPPRLATDASAATCGKSGLASRPRILSVSISNQSQPLSCLVPPGFFYAPMGIRSGVRAVLADADSALAGTGSRLELDPALGCPCMRACRITPEARGAQNEKARGCPSSPPCLAADDFATCALHIKSMTEWRDPFTTQICVVNGRKLHEHRLTPTP